MNLIKIQNQLGFSQYFQAQFQNDLSFLFKITAKLKIYGKILQRIFLFYIKFYLIYDRIPHL